MFTAVTQVIAALVPAYAIYWIFNTYAEYTKAHSVVKDIQGFLTFIPNASELSGVFTKSDRFVLGSFQFWLRKHDLYAKSGWDVSAAISLWPRVRTSYAVSDPKILKEIGAQRSLFPKPTEQYSILNFYGDNIVATEGEQWRLYRKIASPAFSERNNRLVWEESVNTIMSYMDEDWMWEKTVSYDNFLMPCLQFGLRVIAAAGFGKRLGWEKEYLVPPGHQLSFEETFKIVSSDIFIKVLVPNWLPNVTERIRKVRLAFNELKMYMQDIIDDARVSRAALEKDDLFSNLLKANELADGEKERKLDDSELIGNIFIFLLAGHETSSHTLCFAFALLALYEDEQEKLYEDIMSVCPDGIPTYDDMPKLTRSMAVIYETLRLFPSVVGVPKRAAEDTSFTLSRRDGKETKDIAVPKGTEIVVHTTGVHYNPRYWKDPHEFRPERFLDGNWPRDAFIPFSVGARSCLGRRFSEIESVAILSTLVKHYRIRILDEACYRGEKFEQRKERVLKAQWGITLTPTRVPLQFTRR
ncbi:cytochrome p450 [Moniliophthora roreri MCA 2997]|uniref:Cytochrome p450 n=2 Tax=Moniliophthora roreri TaxID=221103 RepID=V2WRR5_MONRO|nr:cytochrome p450 [Moniliophthora roreri MCA 2997]